MKKFKQNNGITLIALVITIIILLILAGISISMLTGQNGLLTKASKAEKETDIVDTKEQIKLEIMGDFDEKTANYTNQDVINAVLKITDNNVEENAPTVESKKGNDVDIKDLWVKKDINITINVLNENYDFVFSSGTTWKTAFSTILKGIGGLGIPDQQPGEDDDMVCINNGGGDYAYFCYEGENVFFKDKLIDRAKYTV